MTTREQIRALTKQVEILRRQIENLREFERLSRERMASDRTPVIWPERDLPPYYQSPTIPTLPENPPICKCSKPKEQAKYNDGLPCGVLCDECFQNMVIECRQRSW